MLACPSCSGHLNRTRTASGLVYLCRRCDGRLASLSVLRQDHVHGEFVAMLWQGAREENQRSSHACPHCRTPMTLVSVPTGTDSFYVVLDVCRVCQCVWFDPGEFAEPPRALPPEPAPLPQRAREALALAEVERIANRQDGDGELPTAASQALPAIFGLPTELNAPLISRRPWVTYLIALLCIVVTIVGDAGALGFVPDQPFRYGRLTFISSFFMHAGIVHLVSNLYFSLVFGDNVEDDIGHGRMLLLLAGGALAGTLLHSILDPRGAIPCVGASGGISSVLAYYAMAFPQARLGLFVRFGYTFKWVSFSAAGGMLIWIVLQFIIAAQQLSGASSVSALAHLAGALIGAVAGWGVARGKRASEAALFRENLDAIE